jgi:hypothetical protein
MEINFNLVSPQYFDATGIARADGRMFSEAIRSPGRSPPSSTRRWPAATGRRAAPWVGNSSSIGDDGPPLEVVASPPT